MIMIILNVERIVELRLFHSLAVCELNAASLEALVLERGTITLRISVEHSDRLGQAKLGTFMY